MGLAHRSLVSPCHSFFPFLSFSLSSSFRMIPWGTGALWVHFFAWASKTRSGRRPASSSGRGRPASSPHQEGPCGLHEWSKFYVNQGRSSLFLSPFTFLIADAVILRDSLDPAGAGPWYGTFCVLLLSLHLMFSSFIHVVACICVSLIFKAE